MTTELTALLNGREAGRVRRDNRGRISFVYHDDWRNATESYPVSISMPMGAAEHGHSIVEAFLWGFLPDNKIILDRWARRFRVSARNPFALIAHVGEDCAGAIQFVPPEQVEACLRVLPQQVVWLDDHAVAERLRLLRADHSAWRTSSDTGQFSLAGAQPKTALLLEDGRWGVPSGRVPTTHIFKPPTDEFDGHAENEHFCLSLARRLGLPTASSSIMRFEDEITIVIERYDRSRTAGGLVRVHQEDVCQAMGVTPTRKYENEGGPGAHSIIELLRNHSAQREEDVSTFLDALAFNWLVAGTDAHAKNYSLLIGNGGRVRLAPLYDLASALAYDNMHFQKLKLAMRIGNDYRLRDIGGAEWSRFAIAVRWDSDRLLRRIENLAGHLPYEAKLVRDQMRSEGLLHAIIDRLYERICVNAVKCETSVKLRLRMS